MSEPTAAPKLSAIQMIEQEIGQFFKQREQAIANVHAVDGAIQAYQQLLAKLRAEAVKAEAEVVKIVHEAESEVGKVIEMVKEKL
jgi:hypothetical protein